MKDRIIRMSTVWLIIVITIILWSQVWRRCSAPGATEPPIDSQVGKVESPHPGGTFETEKVFEHYAFSRIGNGHKLYLGCEYFEMLLYNSNVVLQICNNMDIIKQHVVLSLIRSRRYELNAETGDVISNIGIEPRVLKPIIHYTGYRQYNLDIGFQRYISVYAQGFSYLAKWLTTYDPKFVIDHIDNDKSNNKPDNLRCITEAENLASRIFTTKRGSKPGSRRVRLPIDVKECIKADFTTGISMVKLAEKYKTTRQTIARIVNVT